MLKVGTFPSLAAVQPLRQNRQQCALQSTANRSGRSIECSSHDAGGQPACKWQGPRQHSGLGTIVHSLSSRGRVWQAQCHLHHSRPLCNNTGSNSRQHAFKHLQQPQRPRALFLAVTLSSGAYADMTTASCSCSRPKRPCYPLHLEVWVLSLVSPPAQQGPRPQTRGSSRPWPSWTSSGGSAEAEC